MRSARRIRWLRGLALVALLVQALVLPAPSYAAPGGETCAPGESGAVSGGFQGCGGTGTGGGGGFDIGGLLPIAGIVVAVGIVLVLAFLVLERRTTKQLAPVQPGEWWTCRNCGKNNVVGSARCYACGAWHS